MRRALLARPAVSGSLVLSVLLLPACAGSVTARVDREVSLTLLSPTYGEFLGDGPIEVVGQLSDPGAEVLVEGVVVPVDPEGVFRTTVDFAGDYEIVDVRAGGDGFVDVRERVPVFAGRPPLETFPEALPGRMTNAGLARMGEALGTTIDETGWDAQLLAALPPLDTSLVQIVPDKVTHDPSVVVLKGAEGGIDVGIELRNVVIHTRVTFELFGRATTLPLTVGYETITIGALAIPSIRADGVVILTATDTWVDFGDSAIELDGRPIIGLDFVVDAVGDFIAPAGEFLGDLALGALSEVEVGGPFDFQTDLMGTTLALKLADVYGDPDGLGLDARVSLGEGVPTEPSGIPAPLGSTRVGEPVHVVAGVHEGLLDGLIGKQVMDMLSQPFDLGAYGAVVGSLVGKLPGGDYAPDTQLWCVSLTPGPAKVVRLHEGVAPWGHLYLPDVTVDFAADTGSGCESWLVVNLAMEAAIVAKGTTVGIDLAVAEGVVVSYGAPDEAWTEDEVVAEVSQLVGTLAGFLGGQLSFDLADLLGGALEGQGGLLGGLGPIEPRLLDSEPMAGADGQVIDGMYAVSLSLWAVP
jgi:hypothetical protein